MGINITSSQVGSQPLPGNRQAIAIRWEGFAAQPDASLSSPIAAGRSPPIMTA
jgi:hypothetical protein